MYFRDIREQLLLSYVTNDLDKIEFALLHDLHRSSNPDIPYWKYEHFNLEDMEEDECKTEFRFFKKDIYDLAAILQIPEEIVCYNNVTFGSVEGLCTLLKRFSYPCQT